MEKICLLVRRDNNDYDGGRRCLSAKFLIEFYAYTEQYNECREAFEEHTAFSTYNNFSCYDLSGSYKWGQFAVVE